ncbi:MAG: hypothetical protein U0575_00245 [Phycisphaerales bacterium]
MSTTPPQAAATRTVATKTAATKTAATKTAATSAAATGSANRSANGNAPGRAAWRRSGIRAPIAAALLGLVTAIATAPTALLPAAPRGGVASSVHFQGWFGWIVARQEGWGLTWVNLDRIAAPLANGVEELPSVPDWARPARDDSDDRDDRGPRRVATLGAGWPRPWAMWRLVDRTGESWLVPAAELDDDGEALRKAAWEMLHPLRWSEVRVRAGALAFDVVAASLAWFATLIAASALRRAYSRRRDATPVAR